MHVNNFESKLAELNACSVGELTAQLSKTVDILAESILRGGKIITCGNGGSMAQAMHFAGELAGRYKVSRAPIPAVCISDPTYLTCVANDFGFENVFSRWIEGFGKPHDSVMVFTTSGLSPNIIQAAAAAKAHRANLIVFTGANADHFEGSADVIFKLKVEATPDTTQTFHQLLLHLITEWLEAHLNIEPGSSHS